MKPPHEVNDMQETSLKHKMGSSAENSNGKPSHASSETDAQSEFEQKKATLVETLIEKGLISQDQYQVAQRVQRESGGGKMIGAILVDLGFITENALSEVLSESSGVESFDIKSAVLDPNLIKKVPKEIELRAKAVPVMSDKGAIVVAISDVYNIIALDQIRKYFPRDTKIVPVYSAEADILEIVDQYHDYEMTVDGIIREIETRRTANQEISGELESYTNPTVRLVDAILIDAIKNDASDIHFEPEGAFLRLRYRIDGKMRQIRSFHKQYWPAIAVRIKIMSSINIAETRIPQDGRITYSMLGRTIDFRVATQPTIHGENIVMRILDTKRSLKSFASLGFNEESVQLLKRLLKRPEGIIIVTGPTGSGKTTTLYSILHHINSIEKNIMTLEDPVEYQLSLIRQTNIREATGLTFTGGIRSLLRQDPDIIFVGEVRDEDTANMALRAAMTGHQVFTTLHTNDAIGAIPRLIDIGVKPHMLSGALIGLMAQRLCRRLCPKCKQAYTASPEECKVLGKDPANPPQLYKRVGCPSCSDTGYRGRVAISEILRIDKGLDEMIHMDTSRNKMKEYAIQQGFRPMALDGMGKVLEGVTDLDELINTIDMTEWL